MQLLFLSLCLIVASLGIVLHAQETTLTPQKVLILLGPPGSGKGTQAVRLSKEIGIPHISTGDLFRDNLSRNTELGKKAKAYMEGGKLVPDELVLEMLFDRVSQPDCVNGYLLDGFPRTVPQAEALDKHLGKNVQVIALNLLVRDELIIKRIAGRLTCKKGGHIYNSFLSPPKNKEICDACGGELIQRSDDAPEVVKERLRVYHDQTAPLVKFYGDKGVLIDINGENAPDIVFNDLLQALRK